MLISDFEHVDGKSYFLGKTSLWGSPGQFIHVYFDGHARKEKVFLSSILDTINGKLAWLENGRAWVENLLVERQMVLLAEEWVAKTEEIEKGVYRLRDGEIVSLPIREEDFRRSLTFSGITISFEEDEQNPLTDVFIHCRPSYFGEYGFALTLNHDNSVDQCGVLTEDNVYYYGSSEFESASAEAAGQA